MNIRPVFRTDDTNVGDWFAGPLRYVKKLDGVAQPADILDRPQLDKGDFVVLGGGGLIAKTFDEPMRAVAAQREKLAGLVAWGIGESLVVSREGQFVRPYERELPDYLDAFDLVGLRDYGTRYDWVPCASCLHPSFDKSYEVSRPVAIYEHKRIPIPIEDDGIPRRTNNGQDLEEVLEFLGSSELVITNSYHGAYWASLLGRRVIAIPNMSKMYRLRHAPVIARPDNWQRYVDATQVYPDALRECRKANRKFEAKVKALVEERAG